MVFREGTTPEVSTCLVGIFEGILLHHEFHHHQITISKLDFLNFLSNYQRSKSKYLIEIQHADLEKSVGSYKRCWDIHGGPPCSQSGALFFLPWLDGNRGWVLKDGVVGMVGWVLLVQNSHPITLRYPNIAGWKMGPLKMYLVLKMGIFHCYVSLPEGTT